MPNLDLLSNIPDAADPALVADWVVKTLPKLHRHFFDDDARNSFERLEAAQLTKTEPAALARFINAALLADWACYDAQVDRADYARLQAVIKTFPAGFRVWFCRLNECEYLPVAYTGWYPITTAAFVKVHTHPQDVTHRRELWPGTHVSPFGDYLWLFNYSIVSQLRKSAQSRLMLKTYADDLSAVAVLGLAAAALSKESVRVAERFAMTYRGDMTHAGVGEPVYSALFRSSPIPRPS